MNTTFKAFCNRCNKSTNHLVNQEYKYDTVVEEPNDDGLMEKHLIDSMIYQIIECQGCDYISYRTVNYVPSFWEHDDATGDLSIRERSFEYFYPERIQNSLSVKRIIGLPLFLKRGYQEVVESYNIDLKILCAAGLRMIIEGICNYLNISGKTLGERIDNLARNGKISSELAKSLHIHKYLGNYALHRLEMPEKPELGKAIELLEITMELLFGVPEKHKSLSNHVSDRLKKE